MQKVISKYGFAAHLALVVVAPLFLSSVAILWLVALAAIWLIMEPSRIGREMLHDARSRVASSVVRDPLLWVFVALAIFAGVRCLNTGVALAYDAELARWFVSKPSVEWLPGSVEGFGFSEFACVWAILFSVMGARFALGRSARHVFLLISSLLAGGVALCRIAPLSLLPASAVHLPAVTLQDPAFSGSVYGVFLSLGLCALYQTFEHRWLFIMPLTIFAITGNALGLFFFAPPAVIALFAALFVLVFLYVFAYAHRNLSSGSEFRLTVLMGLELTLAVVLVLAIVPEKELSAKIAPFLTGAFLPEELWAQRQALSQICLKIWKANPWFGCGLGSFPIELNFSATADDWQVVSVVQKTPLNGYWLLLVERGTVGAFMMGVPLVLMLIHYIVRLIKGVRVTLPDPVAWAGLLILIVVAVEGLLTNSWLSPSLLLAVSVGLTVSAKAFPKEKKR